jgi:hypothetical protein
LGSLEVDSYTREWDIHRKNYMLLFGLHFVRDIHTYKELLDLLCKVTGMEVNLLKSSVSFNELQYEATYMIHHLQYRVV